MVHEDHVRLLKNGVLGSGSVWADFGSGNGAFALALAELMGAGATIYSLDKNGRSLAETAVSQPIYPLANINLFDSLMPHFLGTSLLSAATLISSSWVASKSRSLVICPTWPR